MENKLKYLEFIQETIKRMAKNSFALKGWTITIISSIFVLVSRSVNVWYFYLVAIIPLLLFWGLDAYYLQLEREYRNLYDMARITNEGDIDFSMKTVKVKGAWLNSLISKTEVTFYGSTLLVSIVVAVLISCLGI